jgi:hypothetical protein
VVNFVKNISVFSLWLACLAIVAHMIIPHDHHLSESVAGQDDTCPVSDNKTGHKTGLPIHCHALHDLTSDKVSKVQNLRVVPNIVFESSIWSDITTSKIQFPGITIIYLPEPFFDAYLPDLSLLRGPPAIS